jgi:hypothetical protein
VPALVLFNPAYDVSETSGTSSLRVDPERQLAEMVAASQLPPPTINFFGSYDPWRTPVVFTGSSNVSVQGMGRGLKFIDACRQAGSKAELWYAVGEAHGFFSAPKWRERCIFAMDAFLNGLGIIPASPAPSSFAHPELPFVLGTDIHPWRLQWFGNEFATGVAADNANPDGDQFDNFTEFALGTNPTVADSSAAPLVLDPAGITPTLRFSRRQHTYAFGDPAAVVELLTTTTLGPGCSWLPVTIYPQDVVGTNGEIELLNIPLDRKSDPTRFFRLRIRSYP